VGAIGAFPNKLLIAKVPKPEMAIKMAANSAFSIFD
jgi:hypothetical protein